MNGLIAVTRSIADATDAAGAMVAVAAEAAFDTADAASGAGIVEPNVGVQRSAKV